MREIEPITTHEVKYIPYAKVYSDDYRIKPTTYTCIGCDDIEEALQMIRNVKHAKGHALREAYIIRETVDITKETIIVYDKANDVDMVGGM